jgi:hypothetical protein
MVDKPSNDPKVLVEFSPEEISGLADILHDLWAAGVSMKAMLPPEKVAKIQERIDLANKLRNRALDNASKQGFGEL